MPITEEQKKREDPDLVKAIKAVGPMTQREHDLVHVAVSIGADAMIQVLNEKFTEIREKRLDMEAQVKLLQAKIAALENSRSTQDAKILQHDNRIQGHTRHLGNLESKVSKLRGE